MLSSNPSNSFIEEKNLSSPEAGWTFRRQLTSAYTKPTLVLPSTFGLAFSRLSSNLFPPLHLIMFIRINVPILLLYQRPLSENSQMV